MEELQRELEELRCGGRFEEMEADETEETEEAEAEAGVEEENVDWEEEVEQLRLDLKDKDEYIGELLGELDDQCRPKIRELKAQVAELETKLSEVEGASTAQAQSGGGGKTHSSPAFD